MILGIIGVAVVVFGILYMLADNPSTPTTTPVAGGSTTTTAPTSTSSTSLATTPTTVPTTTTVPVRDPSQVRVQVLNAMGLARAAGRLTPRPPGGAGPGAHLDRAGRCGRPSDHENLRGGLSAGPGRRLQPRVEPVPGLVPGGLLRRGERAALLHPRRPRRASSRPLTERGRRRHHHSRHQLPGMIPTSRERRPGVPVTWALPAGIFLGLLLGVFAGVVSGAVLLDIIAWWPVWFVLGALAWRARGRRLGLVRASGLVPLLASVVAVVFLVAHVQGWPLMPSTSGRLIGPDTPFARAALVAEIDGWLRVDDDARFLY